MVDSSQDHAKGQFQVLGGQKQTARDPLRWPVRQDRQSEVRALVCDHLRSLTFKSG